MKILTITTHISSNAVPCFQRNKTGFGFMVHDIITSLAEKGNDVDVLVSWYRFKELHLDGARYIGCSFMKIFFHLLYCLPLGLLIGLCREYPVSKGATLRFIYCWALTGYYGSIIKRGKYDIVHIHGCGLNEELWIRLCQKMNQKYIVTLHGLNSFNDTIKIEKSVKRHEKDFLHAVLRGEHHITVISSGIKNRILALENKQDSEYIDVVCNSFHFEDNVLEEIDVRKQYDIPKCANVLLYVGNVGRNKNQRKLVEAFPLLTPEIRDNTYVLFIGRPSDELNLQQLIEESPCADHMFFVGGVEKSKVPSYYKNATATVLLSYSEGFGLSLVEGMHFGIPCAMFTDMDAFSDLNNPIAVVGIPTRSNEDVARSLDTLLTTNWNKEDIVLYSQKFNRETMAENYLKVFSNI